MDGDEIGVFHCNLLWVDSASVQSELGGTFQRDGRDPETAIAFSTLEKSKPRKLVTGCERRDSLSMPSFTKTRCSLSTSAL